MTWHAKLSLHARHHGGRCLVHPAHEGPLRVLKTLHPEGDAIAHHVIVHPPGGIVGGDRLNVQIEQEAHTHLLLTTPGATRFYRSAGEAGVQQVQARLDPGARLEWLPLETIAHNGCLAVNTARFELDAGAEMIGWDLLALGLPAAGEAFDRGRFEQQIELPGVWLERGVVDGADTRLLQSPVGLAGRSALLTMWFATGDALAGARAEALLDAAREAIATAPPPDALWAGATAPLDRVVVLRALAHRTEPLMALAQAVRAAWRGLAWQLAPTTPRVWRT